MELIAFAFVVIALVILETRISNNEKELKNLTKYYDNLVDHLNGWVAIENKNVDKFQNNMELICSEIDDIRSRYVSAKSFGKFQKKLNKHHANIQSQIDNKFNFVRKELESLDEMTAKRFVALQKPVKKVAKKTVKKS